MAQLIRKIERDLKLMIAAGVAFDFVTKATMIVLVALELHARRR